LNVLMEANGIQKPLQERRRVVMWYDNGNQRVVIHNENSLSDSYDPFGFQSGKC